MKIVGRLTFSIDLDGVLCSIVNHTEYHNAKPVELAINKVREIASLGHRIIIHTSRLEIDREVTEIWLNGNSIPYTELIMGKPRADYYIDDNGILVEEWLNTSYQLHRHLHLVTWEDYLNDIDNLCSKLPGDIDNISGIPRKGLIPATLIALKLRKKMVSLEMVSQKDLIVDDDCKNGKTITELKEKYSSRIAVVYTSPEHMDKIDFYSKVIDLNELDKNKVWLIYPWEYNLIDGLNMENIPENKFFESIQRHIYG